MPNVIMGVVYWPMPSRSSALSTTGILKACEGESVNTFDLTSIEPRRIVAETSFAGEVHP